MLFVVVMLHFNFHASHVNACGAIALATFAAQEYVDAQKLRTGKRKVRRRQEHAGRWHAPTASNSADPDARKSRVREGFVY
jgi:hypothetical protein